MLALGFRSSVSTLVVAHIREHRAPRAAVGTPGLCLSGGEVPDNATACAGAGRFGVSPGRHASFSHREAPLYVGCEISYVKQGPLEGGREGGSCGHVSLQLTGMAMPSTCSGFIILRGESNCSLPTQLGNPRFIWWGTALVFKNSGFYRQGTDPAWG